MTMNLPRPMSHFETLLQEDVRAGRWVLVIDERGRCYTPVPRPAP